MHFLCSLGALLGMSDIELLNISNINCNTIGGEKDEKGVKFNRKIAPLMQEVNR